MPNRKKSRKAQASRSRPKLPEGALETSMTEDERKNKLEDYLKDFDIQGKYFPSWTLYEETPTV